MDGTGKERGNPGFRIRSWIRCLFLSARRRAGGTALGLIGRVEDLGLWLRPDRKAGIILPDFFIVGAQKSGTTSLAVWLGQIPGFRIARMAVPYKNWERREIQFFNNPRVRIRGLRWYSSRFEPDLINGDKTAEYFNRRTALREMRRYAPDARIVLMLRNPVDRAYSAYQHYCRKFPRSRTWDWLLPKESFEENLRAELLTSFQLGFLARGRYSVYLEDLFRLYPPERVKIVIFERFIAHPEAETAAIVEFLGGSPLRDELDYTPANVGEYGSRMDPETRRTLKEYYQPFNEELFRILGFRIDEWGG